MTTIKEIAKLAGVSRGTVDRVLNNRGAVKQGTAERINRIAKELEYSPNRAGKSLAALKKNYKFGYMLFSSGGDNPFFNDVVDGIRDRAKELREYGVTVEICYARIDAPHLQVEQIDRLVEFGVDGLAIVPINCPSVVKRVRSLADSGFPVVTANSDIPGSGRLAYVGSDYFQSGCAAAGLINLACSGSAKVGIVIGSPQVDCHTERVAGFRHRVAGFYPGISISGMVVNNDNDQTSFAATDKLLRENPGIDALFMASAGVAGACRAIEELGLKGRVRVVGYDLTPDIRALLENGDVLATITQQPQVQGSRPLDILLDYLSIGITPPEEKLYTNIEIKIRENI